MHKWKINGSLIMRTFFAVAVYFILSGCNHQKAGKNESGIKPVVADSSLLKPDYPKGTHINSEKRKEITDVFLKRISVPVLASLPLVDDYTNVKFRDSKDVAKRSIILNGLLRVAFKANSANEAMVYFKKYGLWNDVSDDEKKYLTDGNRTNKQDNTMTWRSEGLNVLLWALNSFDTLPLPIHECDLDKFKNLPDLETDPSLWINSVKLRNTEEILNETDLIYRINWATDEARIHKKSMPFNLSADIVYERHYALNWLTMYEDNWDDITTDT